MEDGAYTSLGKGLRVLELLAERSPRGVVEIAQELGLEKSGVSRLLKTLSRWGYVVQNLRRGQYQVGPRVLALVEQYGQSDRLLRASQPVLARLAGEARASAHLGLVAGGQMIVAIKEPSPETIQVASRVGGRVNPHASALGKVLLAGLPERELALFLRAPLERFTERTITDRRKLAGALREIRRKGYAFEEGEEHAGVGCIGAPVKGRAGKWIGAISISGPLQGTGFRLDGRHRDLVVGAAAEISARMIGEA
jgi:DNA-binding IclR family transcriptional regulator